jgi:hypothetical protein
VPDALAALGCLSLLVYDLEGEKEKKNPMDTTSKNDRPTVTRLAKPDEHQRRILDALKVALPD